MSEIKIRSDLPIPARQMSSYSKYPFGEMGIGDSFSIVVSGPFAPEAMRPRHAVANYKFRHPGWNYTSRVADGMLTIWRTA